MKCRLPAEACPATPGRNPCLPSSACTSRTHSAILAGGTQTSSMISDVPGGRSRPTRPNMPSRTCHATSIASASRAQFAGRSSSIPSRIAPARATRSSSAASSAAPNSTSSAADSGGSSSHVLSVPSIECAATISAGAPISSTAVAPAATSASTGSLAVSTSAKCSHEIDVRAGTGTVSKTASAMNASVPSLPMTSRRRISSGVSASRNAHSR